MVKKYERPWYGLTEGPKSLSLYLFVLKKIIITVKKNIYIYSRTS